MRLSVGIDKGPSLQRSVFLSSLLHLLIILLTIIPFGIENRGTRPYYVRLISPMELTRQAGQGLGRMRRVIPRKRVPPPKSRFKRKRIIPKKAHPVKDSKMALRAEEIIAKEIERLRAIKEIERHRMKREEVEIIREGVVSAGEGGSAGEGKGVDADSYYGRVIEMIRNQWVWPEIGSPDLEVIISIRIDGRGNIVSQEIERSSGNPRFDHSALRAISKANPLPPPPFGVETEIGVRFRL